jgi:Dullard-like phosphatase family protein
MSDSYETYLKNLQNYINEYKEDSFDSNPINILPPHEKEYTLILDVDNTLICSTVIEDESITLAENEKIINVCEKKILVKIRPYLQEFLSTVRPHYEIILFTASMRQYANEIKKIIDPDGIFIDGILSRENCAKVQSAYVKNLANLNRDLSKTIIIDDQPHSYILQPDNGIQIKCWTCDDDDDELKILMEYFDDLHSSNAPYFSPSI